jgi:D-alanyl-D-alanine carboxypeptidase/Carboxypeptidase regulatory-like domain/Glucodextranase, domain B
MRTGRPLLPISLLLAAACGAPEPTVEPAWQDHELATVEQGLGVGSVGGCSTGAVKPLTLQLIAELNCIQPNTMVDFRKPNIVVTSTVNPYLAPNAATALQAAANASGTSISIISAYRSVAQQYLLYRWWKQGICGVPLASLPGRSNHQSGRAIDVNSYSSWISRLQARSWTWLGSSDPAHFDYLSAPNFGGRSVLAFQKLWNKNRSNKLVEDGAWGPASESAMAQSPAEGFPISGCAATPPPAPATGTLKGKVFVLDPANPTDMSRVLAQATVKVGGKTLTTDGTGVYSVALAPGTFTVTASAAGHQPATLSRAVTSGNTVWGSVGLLPLGTPDKQPPDISVDSPVEASSSDLAQVVFEGTASDAQGALASFTVSLNGAAAQPVALAQGAFAQSLKLAPGKNVVVFTAKDAAGNTTRATVNATFRAGLEGFVTTEGEAAQPIAGAQLSLVDAGGVAVATAVSADDGSYAFELAQLPAVFTLRVSAPGFAAYEAEVSVGDDARLVWTVSMIEGDGSPAVRLLSPLDGEVVAAETVRVTGVVSGFKPARVDVNQVPVQPDAAGKFELDVSVAPGANTLQVVAVRADGMVVRDEISVIRLSVDAFVNEHNQVRGSCAAAPGGSVVALGLLWILRRRRR